MLLIRCHNGGKEGFTAKAKQTPPCVGSQRLDQGNSHLHCLDLQNPDRYEWFVYERGSHAVSGWLASRDRAAQARKLCPLTARRATTMADR